MIFELTGSEKNKMFKATIISSLSGMSTTSVMMEVAFVVQSYCNERD